MRNNNTPDVLAEVKALSSFLSRYDLEVDSFIKGATTCPHVSETINEVSHDATLMSLLDNAGSGQGSSFGAMTEFFYYVEGLRRNINLLSTKKSDYYLMSNTAQSRNLHAPEGDAAKTSSYILGNSPDQNVKR